MSMSEMYCCTESAVCGARMTLARENASSKATRRSHSQFAIVDSRSPQDMTSEDIKIELRQKSGDGRHWKEWRQPAGDCRERHRVSANRRKRSTNETCSVDERARVRHDEIKIRRGESLPAIRPDHRRHYEHRKCQPQDRSLSNAQHSSSAGPEAEEGECGAELELSNAQHSSSAGPEAEG